MAWCVPVLAALAVMLSAAPAVPQAGGKVHRLALLLVGPTPWPAISKALAARGFVEGRNLVSDVRLGSPEQLPVLARDLAASKPDVIVAISTALVAVKGATDAVPIVGFGPDPVEQGFAASHPRPGGNVTGVAIFAAELDGKRLELLAEAMPGAATGVLLNPLAPSASQSRRAVEAAARMLGTEPLVLEASGAEEYRAAFTRMHAANVRAAVITANAWFFRDREVIGALAREAGVATICQWSDMALSACTIGYGPQRAELYDRVADQVSRILRGAHPRDIPIEQPATFELFINAGQAKAVGGSLSPSALARADKVIE